MTVKRKMRPKDDSFKQLFNEQVVGYSRDVQRTWNGVSTLRGIAWSVDPTTYRPGGVLESVPLDTVQFYEVAVEHWLSRHPVLSKAEVRDTGKELDVILRLAKPIYLDGPDDWQGWAAMVKVVLAALPVPIRKPFPAPMVRALGSVNISARRKVVRLRRGESVTKEQLLTLYRDMNDRPFETVMKVLTGSKRLTHCPVCRAKGCSLLAHANSGECQQCGEVTLPQLYNLAFNPRET